MKWLIGGFAVLTMGLAPFPVAVADPSWTMPNLIGMDLQALRIPSSR